MPQSSTIAFCHSDYISITKQDNWHLLLIISHIVSSRTMFKSKILYPQNTSKKDCLFNGILQSILAPFTGYYRTGADLFHNKPTPLLKTLSIPNLYSFPTCYTIRRETPSTACISQSHPQAYPTLQPARYLPLYPAMLLV